MLSVEMPNVANKRTAYHYRHLALLTDRCLSMGNLFHTTSDQFEVTGRDAMRRRLA